MADNAVTKTALITGASSGIGLELARVIASDGHQLVLTARRLAVLEALAEELREQHQVNVTVFAADLSDPAAADNLLEQLQAENITVDWLINNAGFGDFDSFIEAGWDKLQQMINLNMMALTALCHGLLPAMVAQGHGRIMNVASTAAFQPGPWMAVYYASKAYVLSFSEALGHELKGKGVTVTALCPGATESGFQNAADMQQSALVKNKKLPSSAAVAEYGYRAMQTGKAVAIHGRMNWMMAQSVRLTPRKWVLWMVDKMSKPV